MTAHVLPEATVTDAWLTVEEICRELKVARRTLIGPRCERLGGHGPLRTRRSWLEAWVESGNEPRWPA